MIIKTITIALLTFRFPNLAVVTCEFLNISANDRIKHMSNKPDFFLIGHGKCGTTSLYNLIESHPQICVTGKEIHYFYNDFNYFDEIRGPAWYVGDFKKCPLGVFTIDGTPKYFREEIVPQRIKESYTKEELFKKKLILVLRDPVAREFSWYEHKVGLQSRKSYPPLTHDVQVRLCGMHMETVISSNLTKIVRGDTGHDRCIFSWKDLCDDHFCRSVRCSPMNCTDTRIRNPVDHLITFKRYYRSGLLKLEDSHYLDHLRNWLRVFRQDQIFIVNMQTLIVNTSDTLTRLAAFLNLNQTWGETVVFPHNNPGEINVTLECVTYHRLHNYYQEKNRGLLELINGPERASQQPWFYDFDFNKTARKCVHH